MIQKQIICLANSRKHGSRCIAGKEYDPNTQSIGDWIRPVGDNNGSSLGPQQRQFTDDTEPALLDIVEVPLIDPKPNRAGESYQTENWPVDSGARWKKIATFNRTNLNSLVDNPQTLWPVGKSGRYDKNDKLSENDANSQNCSLYLIHVDNLVIDVEVEDESNGESTYKKVSARGKFTYNGYSYNLCITDPIFKAPYENHDAGQYNDNIDETRYLTISLGELFRCSYTREWNAYKLIAAVIP